MTLSEAVVVLNRELEDLAVKEDFDQMNKLNFVKQEILNHTCRKSQEKKK